MMKLHYAWVVGAMGFLSLFVSIGMVVSAFPVHAPYIIEQWGITMTQYSTMISVRTVAGVIAMYLCGIYYKKLSLRSGLALSLIIGATGSATFALADNFAIGCIAAVLVGLCHGFASMIAIAMLIGNWFKQYRAFMLGACSAASGFCTLVMPKIYVYLIERTSLQTEFMIEAAFYLFFGILLYLLVRDKAADKNLKLLGDNDSSNEIVARKRVEMPKYAPTMFHQSCIMGMCFLIGGFSYCASTNFMVAYTSAGWPTDIAATLLSIFGFSLLVGKFIYGRISDLVPQQKAMFLFFGCIIVADFIVSLAPNRIFAPQVAAMLIYGIGGGLATSGLAIFAIDMSTPETYGKWVRYYTVVYNVGAVIWNPIVGAMADAVGNYSLAYKFLTLLAVIGLILTQTAYIGAGRRYKKLNGAL